MKVELTTESGESVELFLNGSLVAEIFADQARTRDDLVEEIRRARMLRRLPWVVRSTVDELLRSWKLPDEGKPATKKQQVYVSGLMDGLEQKTVPYPMDGSDAWSPQGSIPEIPPDSSPCYRRGYDAGRALARTLEFLEGDQRSNL